MDNSALYSKLMKYLAILLIMLTKVASASVVMTGTRVIYPSDVKSKTLQLNNTDSFFNVVQMWVDVNNPNSTPDDADAPFILNPPIFRIEANSGQNVRLIYTGSKPLPADRESVFYLNMLQVPPTTSGSVSKSQLRILFRHRMKVFYRPTTIPNTGKTVSEMQSFTLNPNGKNWLLTINNASSYFATYLNIVITINGKKITKFDELPMVAPKSSETIVVSNNVSNLPTTADVNIEYILVGDQGGDIPGSFVIHR